MRTDRVPVSKVGTAACPASGAWGRLVHCGASGLLLVALCVAVACHSRPTADTPAPPPGAFWPEQAALDLAWLEAVGDRSSGGRGAARARAFIGEALDALDIAYTTWELRAPVREGADPDTDEHTLETLVAEIPGASDDVFVLAAHYDSPRREGSDASEESASGAALLLGLGRALAAKSLPYTVWLVFVDGDSSAPSDATLTPAERFPGSAALAERLRERGDFDRIRLAVFFRDVADPPLEIARDLHSHRAYREVFFDSARELGYASVFGAGGRYVSGAAGHRAFLARDLRPVVAITGYAPTPEPGAAGEPEPADSTEAFRIVGRVTLEALDRIAARLDRIDRFARAPLEAVDGAEAPARERRAPVPAADSD